jgi:hypothetical protein
MIGNRQYLVTHGRTASLTLCRTTGDWLPQRNDAVVLRSGRGIELGTLLGPVEAGCDTSAIANGELIRLAGAADIALGQALEIRSDQLLEDAQLIINQKQLPLLALDAEFLLDGNEAYLHVLRWGDVTFTPLVESLRAGHQSLVRILDRSDHDAHDHGCGSCGSGGCGSCGTDGCKTGGGCSTGSCSSGSFKSPKDLTDYFLKLREEMLAHPRVPLL